MVLIGIVCVAKDMGIGFENKCLFRIPEDRKFLYDMITCKNVVVGKKTYGTLPIALLRIVKHVHVLNAYNGLPEEYITSPEEYFVLGGAKTYESLSKYIKTWYVTHVDAVKESDSYFKVNLDNFKCNEIKSGNFEGLNYTINVYSSESI